MEHRRGTAGGELSARRDVLNEVKYLQQSAASLDPDERPEDLLRHVNFIGGNVSSLRAAVKRLAREMEPAND